MPIKGYLDSSDYSTLSEPRRLTPELTVVKERLLAWADSGDVEFRYSGVHISEMSPLAPRYVGASEARADMLVQLCGKRTLLAWHELVELEIAAIANDSGPPVAVYSDTGNWFPSIGESVSLVSQLDALKCLDKDAKEYGLNRAQRRALKQKTFKGNRFSDEAKCFLLAQQEAGLKEILKRYPMREADARVVSNYLYGNSTAQEVEEAVLVSLRDPRWMMKWFEKHADQLSPLVQWLRGPGENLRQTIADIAEQASELRERTDLFRESKCDTSITGFDAAGKQRMRENMLASLVGRLAANRNVGSAPPGDYSYIYKNAPGLSGSISAAVDSMFNSISEGPREPKASDFVDMVHALYVSYVDIFRTDAYMAPLISAVAKPYGTTVVGKLKDIVAAIEHRLVHR